MRTLELQDTDVALIFTANADVKLEAKGSDLTPQTAIGFHFAHGLLELLKKDDTLADKAIMTSMADFLNDMNTEESNRIAEGLLAAADANQDIVDSEIGQEILSKIENTPSA